MRIFPGLALLLLFFVSVPVSAEDLQLDGRWIMVYDPDGPVSNEWMVFYNDGTVKIADDRGMELYCVYRASEKQVHVTCDIKGRQQKMVMTVRKNFAELVNPSGAVYSSE